MQIGLLDFGQTKELSVRSRRDYARLVLALATRDEAQIRKAMKAVGIVLQGCSPAFQATACCIMFDTRMDFPEAFMSPTDEAAHEFRRAPRSH